MNPVLELALEKLNFLINSSSGGAHPLDDSKIKTVFKWLHDKGIVLNGDEITLWAKQNGWSEKHALAFGGLAEKIGDGVSVQITHKDTISDKFFNNLLESFPKE